MAFANPLFYFGVCDKSAEDAYTFMAPDPTSYFCGNLCLLCSFFFFLFFLLDLIFEQLNKQKRQL